MQDNELRNMVDRILAKRRLRVDNFNDFLQEVRIRIMKYGLDYCNKGRSEWDCVAGHVRFTHMSYKVHKKKGRKQVFVHQLIDSNDDLSSRSHHIALEHPGFEHVDSIDEVENLHDVIKDPIFTERERQTFYAMVENPSATFEEIGQKMVPPAARGGAYVIVQSMKRKMKQLCSHL